jgi:hypothetical protein
MPSPVFSRLRSKLNQWSFARAGAGIRQTAPLRYVADSRVTVVSMVGHDTVDMYLVAVKSFMVFFSDAGIEAIDDGTLTEEDRALIGHHLPGVHVSEARQVATGSCPSYSSWKRLFRIAEISRSSYVVQLDSDTLTLGAMVEVHDKAHANEGFMIGEGHWSQPVTPQHMQSMARRWRTSGPQGLLEQVLSDLGHFAPGERYLHGCAGFAGYPQGSLDPATIEDLSLRIEQKIGQPNWHRWGSEQAISNCLISRTRNASTLPWPKYRNYMFPPTNDPYEAAGFIHFIGSHRYADSTYCRAVTRFLARYGRLAT